MTDNDHDRAVELIARQGVEEMAPPDASWLESHLSRCAECSDYAAAFAEAGQLWRSFAATAGPALVKTTQARVRARAEQLREQQARGVLMAVSFCIGVLFSTASAWLWWKVGDWVVERLGLPQSIVAPGVLLFWLLPALALAVLMIALPHTLLDYPLLSAWTAEREGDMR